MLFQLPQSWNTSPGFSPSFCSSLALSKPQQPVHATRAIQRTHQTFLQLPTLSTPSAIALPPQAHPNPTPSVRLLSNSKHAKSHDQLALRVILPPFQYGQDSRGQWSPSSPIACSPSCLKSALTHKGTMAECVAFTPAKLNRPQVGGVFFSPHQNETLYQSVSKRWRLAPGACLKVFFWAWPSRRAWDLFGSPVRQRTSCSWDGSGGRGGNVA